MTPFTELEQAFAAHVRNLFNPRMFAWILLTVLLGFVLYQAGHAAKIGSLAVTVFNMSALGYLGYRASNALERGRRPHDLFAEADAMRYPLPDPEAVPGTLILPVSANALERAWQLEQLANSMLVRRFTLVSACVIGATVMKF